MRHAIAPLLILLLLSLLASGCSSQLGNGGDEMGESNKTIQEGMLASAMQEGKYEEIYSQFSKELQELVTLRDFEALGTEFVQGEQFDLISTMPVNGYRDEVWHNQASSPKGIMAVIDEQQTIVGFQVLNLVSYPETDQLSSETAFQLPFQDEWLVFWGGKNVFVNYHYEYDEGRYAYDFVKVKDGYTYEGDPTQNESYYAYDEPVLAPAAGTVIAVVDGIEDNVPGEMNPAQSAGNMVVIEHNNGEKSLLAHFKKDSIKVKVGDSVEAGQLLGTCGNSGNSSEPHIHYEVTKPQADGSELSIPITFEDGKEWVRGDIAVGRQ